MSKLHLIGLCGPDAVGRAAVADLLVTHGHFRKLSFLDALHAELAEGFHVDARLFSGDAQGQAIEALALSRCADSAFVGAAAKHLAIVQPHESLTSQLSKARTPAEIALLWGRAYRHHSDAGYWIRSVRQRLSYYIREYHAHRFVVDHVLFYDEAQALRELGGVVWQVRQSSRTGEPLVDWSDVTISNDHDARHLRQLVLGEYWARDAGLQLVRVEISA